MTSIEKFNAQISNDMQKIKPVLVQIEPTAQKMVDLGLALSGNDELIPINDAGMAAIAGLQNAVASKTGISPVTASAITDAATLGLKPGSANGALVAATPEAVAALTGLVHAAAALNNSGIATSSISTVSASPN